MLSFNGTNIFKFHLTKQPALRTYLHGYSTVLVSRSSMNLSFMCLYLMYECDIVYHLGRYLPILFKLTYESTWSTFRLFSFLSAIKGLEITIVVSGTLNFFLSVCIVIRVLVADPASYICFVH